MYVQRVVVLDTSHGGGKWIGKGRIGARVLTGRP